MLNKKKLNFLKKVSNMKLPSIQSQKKCYLIILDSLEYFKEINMDYFCDCYFRSYEQCISELISAIKKESHDEKSQLATIILKILKKNRKIHLALKWFFKKKQIIRLFKNRIESNYKMINYECNQAYEWVQFKYLKNFIDENILKELGVFKAEDEIKHYENICKERHIRRQILFKTRHLDNQNSQIIEENEKERWKETRYKIYWGEIFPSVKVRVDCLYRQIKRYEKILISILPIIQ